MQVLGSKNSLTLIQYRFDNWHETWARKICRGEQNTVTGFEHQTTRITIIGHTFFKLKPNLHSSACRVRPTKYHCFQRSAQLVTRKSDSDLILVFCNWVAFKKINCKRKELVSIRVEQKITEKKVSTSFLKLSLETKRFRHKPLETTKNASFQDFDERCFRLGSHFIKNRRNESWRIFTRMKEMSVRSSFW